MPSNSSAKITIQRPWWAVGQTQWGGTPFATLGMAWCCWCRQCTDTDTQAEADGHTYVYRRNCKRCGRVVAYGAVQAPLVGAKQGLPAKALRWVHDVGDDRSGKGYT